MLLGPILALVGALFFGLSNLTSRRAVVRVKDISAGVAVTVLISVPALFLALVIAGKVGDIFRFPWHGYLWLLGAGLVHYYVGRSLFYVSIQLVGANISGILRRTTPLVAVTLGIIVLGEVVTVQMLAGVLLVAAGIGIVGWNPMQSRQNKSSSIHVGPKGILVGLGAGACWGISPLMIKMALNSYSAPLAAVFISFIGAAVVHALLHIRGDKRKLLLTMDNRTLYLFSLSGLLVVCAQLSRFFALSMAPISVIAPLFDTTPLMVIGLSYLFNRKFEVFSRTVILSAAIVVSGSLLILWGRA